ncbi:MAG: zf-TFIIB domain-containing protein [Candidatus Thalassarchaeaceae archaeon]|nr:zf-TFIIB domain-containing protein [Candidatus Thalassarchaeaceae archaeon]
MTETDCPCCNVAMEVHGDVVSGQIHYCKHCYGMLASDRWTNTNMTSQTIRNLRSSVFNGVPAGYRCPNCAGDMVKSPVKIAEAQPIEVDGCPKCGSLWFDNREIEPFAPDYEDVTSDQSQDQGKIPSIVQSILDWF